MSEEKNSLIKENENQKKIFFQKKKKFLKINFFYTYYRYKK